MKPNAFYLLRIGAVAVLLLCVVQAAVAQLHRDCTVSVLNRTVQANADGSWVLPNVPANIGQVRARATCVENGTTTSGESAFFAVPVNGIVNLPEIVLGAATPIPVSIGITPANLSFSAIGQTQQLTVTATYPDGSTRNVAAATTGTSYTTSNAAIAAVDPNGLVTAVANGTVIIQATNEGAAGIVTATTVLAGSDTDGDGIPDDIEIAQGLDPNNPIDAEEDFDRDGLTNKEELLNFGTKIRVADTDSDGISDGEEVVAGEDGFVTSPLLADTDGDTVKDGDEIAGGSDPTDPASFPPLDSIEVTPSVFEIVVNSILGVEVSRQLTVTGHFGNGGTIDLTSKTRGTNYSSSDLTVCNFGAQDGRVFAGNDGACTITVTNGGLSAEASITVRTFDPIALSFVDIPGFANNVDVNGDFAYVAAGASGLQVVDVADRRTPMIVVAEDTPGNANDVKAEGDLAYVADGPSGLQIIDIADPLDPQIIGSLDTPGDAQDVVISGNLAYLADGAAGLQIINISDPTLPIIIGSVATPGGAQGVDVDANALIAVVAVGTAGIHVVDISNPNNPAILGSVDTGDARDVAVAADGSFVFVADLSSSLTAVDITNPSNPIVRSSTPRNTGGLLVDAVLSNSFVFGADIFFVNGVPIIDVSTPENPSPRFILNFMGFRDDNGTGIAVDRSFVYLTAARGSSTRLYIGQYLELEDTFGIPPTATITSPFPGETVVEGARLPITVDATDDIAVATVAFLVDGQVVFTDTAAPYEFTLDVPVGVNSLTLGATAVDLGGNQSSAQDVIVNVIPDPLTTVEGVVVDPDGLTVQGALVETAGGRSGITGAGGAFSIADVPTALGNINANASFTREDGTLLSGRAGPVAPVAGGITDVGIIHLARTGLIAFWPFDDGTDPTADIVGGHDGDIIDATFTSTDIAPVLGNVSALVFDGSGDQVVVADANELDFGSASPMSIALWFKATALRGTIHILGKRSGCSSMNYQLARDGGLLHFNSDGGRVNTGVDIRVNDFMHMAVTYDGINTLKVYIDGVEVASKSPYTLRNANSAPLKIGASGTCGNDFPGVIDEVQIFDRALGPQEIAVLAGLGDADGDGMPDKFEIENDLNPIDPADALGDADGDGLSNKREYELGTGVRNPDTDNDGRLDGQEFLVDGTDPTDPLDVSMLIPLTPGQSASDQAMPAVDLDGNIHVAWVDLRDDTNGEIYYTMLAPDGTVLIDDTRLTTDPAQSRRPAIAVDSVGHVIVVWQDQRLGSARIFYTKLDPSQHAQDSSAGTDASLALVDDSVLSLETAVQSDHPRLVIDQADRVHVVWENTDLGEVRYAQIANDGVIAIADQPVFQGGEHRLGLQPTIAADSFGDLHIALSEQLGTCESEIFYTMLDGQTGAVRIAPTRLTDDDCIASQRPTVGVGPDNTVAIVFEDNRLGSTETFLRRLNPALDDQDGGAANPALITVLDDTLLSIDDGRNSNLPSASVDLVGNQRVTYYDDILPGGSTDLLFQIADAMGNVVLSEVSLSEGPTAGSALSDETLGFVAVDGPTTHITWTDTSMEQPEVVLLTLSPDPDRDGLSNAREFEFGTEKDNGDTDGDSLSDGFEVANGLDPIEAVFDVDNDGLTNTEELTLGTNPLKSDSDGDGAGDGAEVAAGSDPLDPSSFPTYAGEAVGFFSAILNTTSPPPASFIREADGKVFSTNNAALSPANFTRETVGPFFSIENLGTP